MTTLFLNPTPNTPNPSLLPLRTFSQIPPTCPNLPDSSMSTPFFYPLPNTSKDPDLLFYPLCQLPPVNSTNYHLFFKTAPKPPKPLIASILHLFQSAPKHIKILTGSGCTE